MPRNSLALRMHGHRSSSCLPFLAGAGAVSPPPCPTTSPSPALHVLACPYLLGGLSEARCADMLGEDRRNGDLGMLYAILGKLRLPTETAGSNRDTSVHACVSLRKGGTNARSYISEGLILMDAGGGPRDPSTAWGVDTYAGGHAVVPRHALRVADRVACCWEGQSTRHRCQCDAAQVLLLTLYAGCASPLPHPQGQTWC